MTFVSILAVFGSNGAENKSDTFQKLFYDGLVTALGSYASDVDAVVATSDPITHTKLRGDGENALFQTLSSGAPLRALFQPELKQFQTAFEEAVAEAADAVGSGIAVVVVVYAGQVLHSTGEWLLSDSTFSGEQLEMWLDSEAASAWHPRIQKLTSAPSGTEPINIIVCTPSAGAKTRWPIPPTPDATKKLVMLSKSRRLPVRLRITASWRINGKLASAAPINATSYEALQALSGDLARLHWEHQSELLAEAEKLDYSLAQCSFKRAPPALYVIPSGSNGVQTQACGLLVIHGFHMLLGSAFTDTKPPQWWPLVRSLDGLDAVVFPDWSASSIQSYRFLNEHLFTSSSNDNSGLGWVFTPSPIEPGSESPILLTPPVSNPHPSQIHYLTANDQKTRLFYKIGVGELTLHWLGATVGALIIWQPALENKKKGISPLTVFLPVSLPPENVSTTANSSPAGLLAGMVRVLRKVPEISKGSTATNEHSITEKKMGIASAGAPGSNKLTKMRNGTLAAAKTQVNGGSKHTSAGRLATTASAASRTAGPKSASLPRHVPNVRTLTTPSSRMVNSKPSTTPASRSVPSRPSTASSAAPKKPNLTPAARPLTKTRITTNKGTKTDKEITKPAAVAGISKTGAKLAELAANVAAATSKPGHEIKYAPPGKPSNLPPRRKVGEKTVMEELNELPEMAKSPAPMAESLPEPTKESQQHEERQREDQIPYPDSLGAEEEQTNPENLSLQSEVDVATEMSSKIEMPLLPTGLDFTLPSSGLEYQKEQDLKSPVRAEEPPSDLPESFDAAGTSPVGNDEPHHKELGMTKSPEMEFGNIKPSFEHEEETDLSKSAEEVLSKECFEMQHSIPSAHQEDSETLKSSVGKEPADYQSDTKSPEPIFPFGEVVEKPLEGIDSTPHKSLVETEFDKSEFSTAPMEFTHPSEPEHHEELGERISTSVVGMDVKLSRSSESIHEGMSSSPSQMHHEVFTPKAPAEADFGMPSVHQEDDKSFKSSSEGFSQVKQTTPKSSEAITEEALESSLENGQEEIISKSPVGMNSSMPSSQLNESAISKSPLETLHPSAHENVEEDETVQSPTEIDPLEAHEEISKAAVEMQFSVPPEQRDYFKESENLVEVTESTKPIVDDEIPMSKSEAEFSIPPDQYSEGFVSPKCPQEEVQELHNETEISKTPYHEEEFVRSPVERDSFPSPDYPEEFEASKPLTEIVDHNEVKSSSPVHEESSKSPVATEFSIPQAVSDYPDASEMSDPTVQQNEISERDSKSPHEEVLQSRIEVDISIPQEHQNESFMQLSPGDLPNQDFDEETSKPPTVAISEASIPTSQQPETLEVSRSSLKDEEVSESPTFSQEYYEKSGLSSTPFVFSESHPEQSSLGTTDSDSKNLFQREIPGLDINLSKDTNVDLFEKSESSFEPQFLASHDTDARENLAPTQPPNEILSCDVPEISSIAMNDLKHDYSTVEMDIDRDQNTETAFEPGSYESDVDARPSLDRLIPQTGEALSSWPSEAASESVKADIPDKFLHQPEEEFPVHEMSLGGGSAIPEVSDHVDSSEAAEESMPPIHNELLYQLQSDCTAQPADSTTTEASNIAPPKIGFMEVESIGKIQEENIHSPSSEMSNDSVIHTEAEQPAPAGFIPEMISPNSPKQSEPAVTSPTSGFSSEHPLLYNQRTRDTGDLEALEQEITTTTDILPGHKLSSASMEMPPFKSSSPQPHGTNGMSENGDSVNASEKPADGSNGIGSRSAAFDPLMEWGHPQDMPSPLPQHRSLPPRTSKSGTASSLRTANLETKTPENLPPGPPVLLDVVWVPSYVVRVPFTMATQFFAQIRARVYIISGECLHPITGEALIAGVSQWTPEERQAVCKHSGGRGIEGIVVVPTEETQDWVQWLVIARDDGKTGTGEKRLLAAGLTVLPFANLCEIKFSDQSSGITCPGIQLMI